MNELLTALDESVFTPELTQKIQDLFESKVQAVEASMEVKILEAQAETKDILEKLALTEAKAEEFAEYAKNSITEALELKAQEYGNSITESLTAKGEEYAEYMKEEYSTYMKEELEKTLDAYLGLVAEEFIQENKIAMDEASKTAKVNAILEGFESLLTTTGVDLSAIVEASAPKEIVEEDASLKKAFDKLVQENAVLKAEKQALIKESITEKYTSDMSIVQKDSFSRLAEMVAFSDSATYETKLSTIAETVSKKAQAVVETPMNEGTDVPKHKRWF